ncbi:MAG: hypothetical protein GF401_11485 [Chitinivibrionales bacterium]|nr:hypothetical protein [Chitinivibrionales bacterium]
MFRLFVIVGIFFASTYVALTYIASIIPGATETKQPARETDRQERDIPSPSTDSSALHHLLKKLYPSVPEELSRAVEIAESLDSSKYNTLIKNLKKQPTHENDTALIHKIKKTLREREEFLERISGR